MTARIAINGFGRIGRASFKISLDKGLEVVAINDLINPRVLAYLLKYDTVYNIFDKDIYVEEDGKKIRVEDAKGDKSFFTETGKETYLVVGKKKTLVLSEKEPDKLPWKDLNIDVVLECTGLFTKKDEALKHIDAGAKNVIVSAPTKDGTIQTFLKGVNDSQYLGQNAISNASCTTNCVSPVVSVMHSNFKVKKAMLTTIHAVTAGQNIVDGPPNPKKPDLRRARAGWQNIVPTTTGAAQTTTQTIPDLKDKFDGLAIRVPILTGSLIDVVMIVDKKTTVDEVNSAFEKAQESSIYKGVLKTTWEPIVSSDIIGDPHSAIVDLSMTRVVDGDFVKVLAWYDNEWGYAARLVEMAQMMAN
ncbi:type I glyceraldehyde-3-phosphate dehydrogenase [Patescibacteria group bacterium]